MTAEAFRLDHASAGGDRSREAEAARAGSMLAEHGVLPAFLRTSLQQRTIRTANIALAAADRDWIPVRRSWRLNGRHCGGAARAEQGRRAPAVPRLIPLLVPAPLLAQPVHLPLDVVLADLLAPVGVPGVQDHCDAPSG